MTSFLKELWCSRYVNSDKYMAKLTVVPARFTDFLKLDGISKGYGVGTWFTYPDQLMIYDGRLMERNEEEESR